jgi:hypothetical protein
MALQSELPCWEIIHCNRKQMCLLGGDTEKACWDLVKDDEACSFHICVDCLVYLAKQKDSPLSEEEFCSILEQRRVEGSRGYECSLAHSLL